MGQMCSCNNATCIDCEVAMTKCPFCRKEYSPFFMFVSKLKLDKYISRVKDKDLQVSQKVLAVFSSLENMLFEADETYYELVEDFDVEESMYLFLLLKEKFHKHCIRSLLFWKDDDDDDAAEELADKIMDRIMELGFQSGHNIEMEVQEDITNRCARYAIEATKDRKKKMKKIKNAVPQKLFKNKKPHFRARANHN